MRAWEEVLASLYQLHQKVDRLEEKINRNEVGSVGAALARAFQDVSPELTEAMGAIGDRIAAELGNVPAPSVSAPPIDDAAAAALFGGRVAEADGTTPAE
jgi:hypothetical protein